MKIGAQFYTIRDFATTTQDLSECLKKVADIGYTTVQLSGVCPYEPEWMKEELKKNGLKCVLTHWNGNEVKNDPVGVANTHKIFGCNYIGLGCMPDGCTEENTYKFIKDFKETAKILKDNSAKLFYHNHHFEFAKCADKEMIFDKLINSFTPEELGFTFDTYWAQMGGVDVCDFMDKLKGRIQCMHLKDLEIVGSEQRMAPVGQGSLNFAKIINKAEDCGAEFLLVEQDNCYGKDPFECLKQSYEYLKSLGLN